MAGQAKQVFEIILVAYGFGISLELFCASARPGPS